MQHAGDKHDFVFAEEPPRPGVHLRLKPPDVLGHREHGAFPARQHFLRILVVLEVLRVIQEFQVRHPFHAARGRAVHSQRALAPLPQPEVPQPRERASASGLQLLLLAAVPALLREARLQQLRLAQELHPVPATCLQIVERQEAATEMVAAHYDVLLAAVVVKDVKDQHHGLLAISERRSEALVPGRVQVVVDHLCAVELADLAVEHDDPHDALRVALAPQVRIAQVLGLEDGALDMRDAREGRQAPAQQLRRLHRRGYVLLVDGDPHDEPRPPLLEHGAHLGFLLRSAFELALELLLVAMPVLAEVHVGAAEEVVAAHEAGDVVVGVVDEELQAHQVHQAPTLGAGEAEVLVPARMERVLQHLRHKDVDQVVVGPNALDHAVRVGLAPRVDVRQAPRAHDRALHPGDAPEAAVREERRPPLEPRLPGLRARARVRGPAPSLPVDLRGRSRRGDVLQRGSGPRGAVHWGDGP
mmetsp:Transcript_45773/g.146129  ORF Transcript_45773/g.146129 Transcript_45773/m.146129 type:complete len:472 (+) Transcript_45773:1110-2525(+)